MITLVLKGADAAKLHNSKRVTAQHLKSAILSDKNFDFLADICADVPDEDKGGVSKKSGGKAKQESEEETDEDMADVKPKKDKRRKRKDSEDSD
jgi:hypothetical protein